MRLMRTSGKGTRVSATEMDNKAIRIVGLGLVLILLTGAVLHSRPIPTANRRRALVLMESFVEPISLYRMDTGSFPVMLEDLRVRPCDADGWRGPYIDNSPLLDPWGKPYRYELKSRVPTLASAGPDRKWGTPDDIGVE